jgi:hypothetical protein
MSTSRRRRLLDGFNIERAVSDAWTLLWASNIALRGKGILNHRYNETFYLTASDLEGQVRRFAVEHLEGKPRGSTGRAYGSGEGGDGRIRFRGNLLGTVRDWLRHNQDVEVQYMGRYQSVTKARYRPKGEPIGPAFDETLVHFRVDNRPGCGKPGPNAKPTKSVTTGILGNVTCPRCRSLKEFKTQAAA